MSMYPVPAMTQGARFSMCIAAACENEKTNVRFNEIMLVFLVEVDEVTAKQGSVKTTDFGKVYELLLDDKEVRSSRVSVDDEADMETLRWKKLF